MSLNDFDSQFFDKIDLMDQFSTIAKTLEEPIEKYKSALINFDLITLDDLISHVTSCEICKTSFKFNNNIFSPYQDLRRCLPTYVFPCGNTFEDIFITRNIKSDKNKIDFWDFVNPTTFDMDFKGLPQSLSESDLQELWCKKASFTNEKEINVTNEKKINEIEIYERRLEVIREKTQKQSVQKQDPPPAYDSIYPNHMIDNFVKTMRDLNDYFSVNVLIRVIPEERNVMRESCAIIERIINFIASNSENYKTLVPKFSVLKENSLKFERDTIASDQIKSKNCSNFDNNGGILTNINGASISFLTRYIENHINEIEKRSSHRYSETYTAVIDIFRNRRALREIQKFNFDLKTDIKLRSRGVEDYSSRLSFYDRQQFTTEVIHFIDAGLHELLIHLFSALSREIDFHIIGMNNFYSNSLKYYSTRDQSLKNYSQFDFNILSKIIKRIGIMIHMTVLINEIYDSIEDLSIQSMIESSAFRREFMK